jgi:hypothetical protein
MAQSVNEKATASNARTAAAAAGLVVAVLIAQVFVRSIISMFGNAVYSGFALGGDPFAPLGSLVVTIGTSVLPVAIGVFLAFWFIVPLTADLRIAPVLLRSLIAAGVAAVVTLVFTSVFAAGGAFTSAGAPFGESFPRGMDVAYAVFGTVQTVLDTLIGIIPLVLLVGVLVWLWFSKPRAGASA